MYNDELHNLYSLPNLIRMIKSRRMRWAENAAQMGRRDTVFWWESQKVRGH
jgi:hypothetical protein